jgi:hypothetical protein
MRIRAAFTVLAALLSAVGWTLVPATATAASAETAWSLQSMAAPTNFEPAGTEEQRYEVFLANIGAKASDPEAGGGPNPIVLTDTLPAGLKVKSLILATPEHPSDTDNQAGAYCEMTPGAQVVVNCEIEGEDAELLPGEQLRLTIGVEIPGTLSGPLVNQAQASGAGGAAVATAVHNQTGSGATPKGFQNFSAMINGPDGKPVGEAASHPYLFSTTFAVNLKRTPKGSNFQFAPAGGDLKDIEVTLPPGLIGNPTVVERCSPQQFNTLHGVIASNGGSGTVNECPDSSAVGLVGVRQLEGSGRVPMVPVYDLVPPPGMPAQLGFQVLGLPIYINFRLRSDGDYGITGFLQNTTEAKRVTAATVLIWGVPGEASHDSMRGTCATLGRSCPFERSAKPDEPVVKPFMRLPSSCENPLTTTMVFNSWGDPTLAGLSSTEPAPVDCAGVDFSPSIEAKPTTDVADAPSGFNFDLHVPQAQHEGPEERAEADLRDAVVTLPEGLLVNPSSADGLGACTEEQVGYRGVVEGRNAFTAAPAQCSDAAKVGTVEVDTPLVDHPLPGAVYLAQPHENPFGSLIALYIAIADPKTGVVVKVPAKVELDPGSGRITTVVQQNPQTPFEDFRFKFFEGARAPLRTPAVCATHTTTTSLTPYSAPASGPPATPSDSFAITTASGGGSCPTSPGAEPNSPRFEAGTAKPLAGAYSPFTLRLSRADGSQELKGLSVSLPPGLAGKLAGVAECPEAAIAAAGSQSGRAEQATPSCPASSEVGTVTVGAGAGPAPYYAHGRAYLAGPYKDAPLSLAIITPAVAGPFDLGTVVVRTALEVDPETAEITAKSDPLPTILQGIPLDVRSVEVNLDRNQFSLNPTSCEVKSIAADATSVLGQTAHLSNRFQVGGCDNLRFKPSLSLRLKGGIKRGAHPSLRAVVTYPNGSSYANIAKVSVGLPHSEFLEQAHIRTICTRVQFNSGPGNGAACPRGSIYGKARATTPLLDAPLEGPVYLRSSSNPLPDMVLALHGQIDVAAVARIDSHNGGLRSSFEMVPDAPISKVVVELQGGKKGLLVNSRNICKTTNRVTAKFTAQNAKTSELRPLLKSVDCKGKPHEKKHNGHRGKGTKR